MATSFEESSQSSVQYVSSCESLQPYSPPTANVCNSGWLSGAQESVNHWGIRTNSPSAFEGGHTCSCLTHFCCKALVVTLRDKKQPPKDFSFTLFPVFILFLYCTIWEQKIHFLSLTLFPPKHMSTPLLPLYLSFLCIASSFSTSPWQREGHVVLFRWEHLEVAYCSSYLFNLFTLFFFLLFSLSLFPLTPTSRVRHLVIRFLVLLQVSSVKWRLFSLLLLSVCSVGACWVFVKFHYFAEAYRSCMPLNQNE